MAVINTIASKSAGCGGKTINTGDLGCDIEFGLVIHALGIKRGVVIPSSTDITQEYIDKMVQSGDLIPIMDAFSSEPTIAEDTLETSPLGVESLTLKGLPKYMLTMKKGQYYYKEMAKLTGFGNLSWILGDVNGNWKFAVTSDGDFTGFTAGQTLAAITVPATATETEKKSVTFQLTDRRQIDLSYAVVLASNLFPISDVSGVNGVDLAFEDANGPVVPSSGDTDLKIRVLLSADKHTPVEGLTSADFVVELGGIDEAVTATDDGNGYYTLTTASLSGVIKVKTYDSVEKTDVIISEGVLFRSAKLSATLA
jgi:hypothetical protein